MSSYILRCFAPLYSVVCHAIAIVQYWDCTRYFIIFCLLRLWHVVSYVNIKLCYVMLLCFPSYSGLHEIMFGCVCTVPYHFLSCRFIPYSKMPYHITSYRTGSKHIICHTSWFYHIISCHVISSQNAVLKWYDTCYCHYRTLLFRILLYYNFGTILHFMKCRCSAIWDIVLSH